MQVLTPSARRALWAFSTTALHACAASRPQKGQARLPKSLRDFQSHRPATVAFFKELAERRGNKLRKDEYDVTTWSARTWHSFAAQKVSVALHVAVAYEVVHALGLSAAVDERVC